MNLGKYIEKCNRQILNRYGNTVTVVYKGIKCPGAFNLLGNYDRLKDIEYHTANPEAEICENGYIKNVTNTYKCSIYTRYTVIEPDAKIFGELEDDDFIFIFPSTAKLEDVDYFVLDGVEYKLKQFVARKDTNTITDFFCLVKKEVE